MFILIMIVVFIAMGVSILNTLAGQANKIKQDQAAGGSGVGPLIVLILMVVFGSIAGCMML